MATRTVLLTGGAGYIGSHTCVALLERGDEVVIVDDLSNSSAAVIDRVRELAPGQVTLHEVDIRDEAGLETVLDTTPVDAVIHFAGLKAVGESIEQPLHYYDVNVAGTISLLRVMSRRDLRRLVFSSSATVYGDPERVPCTEDAPLTGANPYGRSKLMVEEILRDLAHDPSWHIACLRYFNPVGAHPSGRIGEDPTGIPNNLMPYIMQVAVGRRPELTVFGDDYPTRDGTCIRDYIHVVDLAEGHLAALDVIGQIEGCQAINLGTGHGHTVREVLDAAGRAVGREIPQRVGARRPGDAAESWADPTVAENLFGWKATRTLDDMCVDSWRWQSANPSGYADAGS